MNTHLEEKKGEKAMSDEMLYTMTASPSLSE